MAARENTFINRSGKFVDCPAHILFLCLFFVVCRISIKKCFRNCGASCLEIVLRSSSLPCLSWYHNFKRRTNVFVLFLVLFDTMLSLKAAISVSV